MSTPSKTIFLRRTLAALVAVAVSFAASDAAAQSAPKVTLKTSTGDVFCDYSDINMKPNGSVTVTCGSTPPPPPPTLDPLLGGVFVTAMPTTTGVAGSTAAVTVNRTVGGMAQTLYFWYAGSGCRQHSAGALEFALNQASATIDAPLSDAPAGSTCTVNLAAPVAGSLGAQTTTTITLTSASPPPPPPVAGCPAAPQGLMEASLPAEMGHVIRPLTTSGQVVAMKVPRTGFVTGMVGFSDSPSAYSPNPVTMEISVNKCRGHIDTDMSNQCNFRSNVGVTFSVMYFLQPYGGLIVDEESAKRYNQCWAGTEGTQYYVNARWAHQGCPYGQLTCGWNVQHNRGTY